MKSYDGVKHCKWPLRNVGLAKPEFTTGFCQPK